MQAWWSTVSPRVRATVTSGAYAVGAVVFLPPVLERCRLAEAASIDSSRRSHDVPPRFWDEMCLIAARVGVDAGHKMKAVVTNSDGPGVVGTRWLPHVSCFLAIPASAVDAAEVRCFQKQCGLTGPYDLPPGFRFEIAHEFAHVLREDGLLRAFLVGNAVTWPCWMYTILRQAAGWSLVPAAAVGVVVLFACTTFALAVWRRVELRADRTAAACGFLREGVAHMEQRARRHEAHHEMPTLLSTHFPLQIRLAALKAMQVDARFIEPAWYCNALPYSMTLGLLRCNSRLAFD